jgi:trigger factor
VTLIITKHEDDQRQLHLQVEIPAERMDKALRAKARDLSRQLRIPGFRPGKAPYGVVLQRFGEEALRYEVLEKILPELVEEAFKQEGLNPYAQPVLSNLEITPPSFEVIVPLEPIIELGDYRAVRRELGTAEVTEEAVDQALELLLEREAETEEQDRPAELGDLVTVMGVGAQLPLDAAEDWQVDHESENQIFHDHSGTQFPLDEEKNFFGGEFVRQLVGATAGDALRFNITLEDDERFGEEAGVEVQFALEVVKVESRTLPELNDEFAKTLDYESLEALRTAERTKLETRAQQETRNEFFDAFTKELVAGATIAYPPALVTERIDERLERFKEQIKRYGWKWEDYLEMQDQDEEYYHELWQESAAEQVQETLALQAFIKAEQLRVAADDIEGAIEKQMDVFRKESYFNEQLEEPLREQMRKDPTALLNELLLDKVYDRMVLIGAGNAPDLTAEEAPLALEAETAEGDEEAETSETA